MAGVGAAWAILKEWGQLLIIAILTGMGTVGAWYGIRYAEASWLQRDSRIAGQTWGTTLQSGLGDFGAVLRNGHVSSAEQQFIDAASRGRSIVRYRLFNARGGIVLSSDRTFRVSRAQARTFGAYSKRGRVHVAILEDQDFGGQRRILGESLVPMFENGRFLGAIEVLVNMTELARDIRETADSVLYPLIAVMTLAGLVSMGFAVHGIRRRAREFAVVENARERAEAAEHAAEQANRSKSEFLATMSHELRTPLNAIIGFSELMKSEAFGELGNPRYKEFAKDIHAGGTHLLEVINDILDLSKIEAGHFDLDEEELDVRPMIDSCIRLISARAEAADITVEVVVEDEMPRLMADIRKVKQVLINLLSNAVKFTPPYGSVILSAWVENGIRFSVADTGIGIAEADISTVLEPFGQVEDSRTRNFEGTGLGLPLARSLMELHGGSLQLESQVEKGTTVTVVFPESRIVPPEDRT